MVSVILCFEWLVGTQSVLVVVSVGESVLGWVIVSVQPLFWLAGVLANVWLVAVVAAVVVVSRHTSHKSLDTTYRPVVPNGNAVVVR